MEREPAAHPGEEEDGTRTEIDQEMMKTSAKKQQAKINLGPGYGKK